MPIYEYRCTACDHLAEVIHGINDPGPRFCESCGAEDTMRKGFGTPAVLYKGSGWARKDRPLRTSPSAGRSDGSRTDGSSSKADDGKSGAGSGPESTSATTSGSGSADD
ncbi:MAG TPA: zinc ribbon domain-containing protein [Candidatus Deferrimicrobiaceae bacterium]|nr:zinc ribbon domain-containing protein [Candidatus Deferrimicrobiaceae bacterium]